MVLRPYYGMPGTDYAFSTECPVLTLTRAVPCYKFTTECPALDQEDKHCTEDGYICASRLRAVLKMGKFVPVR